MKNVILKILKEGEFDWIQNTPSFLEILGPISNRNPKDSFRLHFNLGYGENGARWSSDWVQFNNNTKSLNNKITHKSYNMEIYYKGNEKYIVANNELVYIINSIENMDIDNNMMFTRETINKDDYYKQYYLKNIF